MYQNGLVNLMNNLNANDVTRSHIYYKVGENGVHFINSITHFCKCHKIELKKAIQISHDINGKPYCNVNGIYISISHSFNITLLGISRDPIGIDVEYLSTKDSNNFKDIVATNEYMMWTKIESCGKLLGCGLKTDMNSLVELVENNIFNFKQLIFSNYIISVCQCKKIRSMSEDITLYDSEYIKTDAKSIDFL